MLFLLRMRVHFDLILVSMAIIYLVEESNPVAHHNLNFISTSLILVKKLLRRCFDAPLANSKCLECSFRQYSNIQAHFVVPSLSR